MTIAAKQTENTLTDKELAAINAFIDESISCCDAFSDDDNMSMLNIRDVAAKLKISLSSAAGLFSALDKKNLLSDLGESYRGANINDWAANPIECRDFPQIAHRVTA